MNRSLLLALGFILPACSPTPEATSHSGSAQSESDPDQAYFESQAFLGLSPANGALVRDVLRSTPGAGSHSAALGLFSSPSFVALGARDGVPNTCLLIGSAAQRHVIQWVTKRITLAGEDRHIAADIARLAPLLAVEVNGGLDGLMLSVQNALAAQSVQPSFAGWCADATTTAGTSSTRKTTQTSWGLLLPNQNHNGMPAEAASELTSKFASVAPPSRGMLREWSSLRAQYQAAGAGSSLLRAARREGSNTLRRDALAGAKFDQASMLVDRFVANGIALNADAMNTVHAVLGGEGRMRQAGEEVRAGFASDRMYLPGAAVAANVRDVFAKVRRAGRPTPELAALFDQQMISIHPYMDANGRTTRLMTDWLLARDGYPPMVAENTPSSTLYWQRGQLERGAHLERITDGMRAAVRLIA